jgi:MscS family membrane protein
MSFESIAEWLVTKEWLGNECLNWLTLVVVLLASMVIGAIISKVLAWQANRLAKRERWVSVVIFCRAMHKPVLLLALGVGLWCSQFFMDLGPVLRADGETVLIDLWSTWSGAMDIVFSIAVGWMIYRLSAVAEHWLTHLTRATATTIDDKLVPIVIKALKAFLFVTAVLYVLRNGFHRDVSALIAGLGLTGLAIALASQHMVGHLFGSVMILMDNSFEIGDTITVAGATGTVQDVGLRSTRVKMGTGEVVAIPNGTIANTVVKRDVAGDQTRRFTVKVTGAADPARLAQARGILAALLEEYASAFNARIPAGAFFRDADVGGMTFEVVYALAEGDIDDLRAFNDAFNTALLDRMIAAELTATFTA